MAWRSTLRFRKFSRRSVASGYAGLEDRVDNHWARVFLAAGLATVLNIGLETGPDEESGIARAIREGTQDTIADRDIRSLVSESDSSHRAKPARASCDQSYFPLQRLRHDDPSFS